MNAPVTQAPANDVKPTLAEQLEASCAIADAIERIDVVYAHTQRGNAWCPCGAARTRCCATERPDDFAECAEVYVLDGAVYCTRECLVYGLLWSCSPSQDQSTRAVQWVESLIEASFARARERAVGGG